MYMKINVIEYNFIYMCVDFISDTIDWYWNYQTRIIHVAPHTTAPIIV